MTKFLLDLELQPERLVMNHYKMGEVYYEDNSNISRQLQCGVNKVDGSIAVGWFLVPHTMKLPPVQPTDSSAELYIMYPPVKKYRNTRSLVHFLNLSIEEFLKDRQPIISQLTDQVEDYAITSQ